MKLDTKAPVAAPSTSGLSDLIDALNEAERAGADARAIGRIEGQIAALPCESVADVAAKAEFLLGMLTARPDMSIECEIARTICEFAKAAR
jgi:hypothetical protein